MDLSLIPNDLMEEWASEYIARLKLDMDISSVVEELHILCLDLPEECLKLKNIFAEYIETTCEEYRICKECFTYLQPVVTKEYHNELDECTSEDIVDGYMCETCNERYDY